MLVIVVPGLFLALYSFLTALTVIDFRAIRSEFMCYWFENRILYDTLVVLTCLQRYLFEKKFYSFSDDILAIIFQSLIILCLYLNENIKI